MRTQSRQIRNIIILMCMLLLFIGVLAGCDVRESALPEKDIMILYTNDVHCAVDNAIGYTGVAALKQTYQENGADVLLVDCGDAIQGAPIGTISKGAYIIDIMNEMGYDVATLGNHEFDYGSERLLTLAEQAEFPYVACNFRDVKTGNTVFDAYKLVDAGGVQIAFIGIVTPEAILSSAPAYFQDETGSYIYSFDQKSDGSELYDSVQKAVDHAREDGADYVIALSHLGVASTNSAFDSTTIIANTTGIDVVLDGHSHSAIACERVKNAADEWVLLSQTGSKLESVGMLLIQQDGSISTGLITDQEEKDADIASYIAQIQSEFADEMQTVVARTNIDLTILNVDTGERRVRNGETNLADLCADAYRLMSGADIGMINGGGVRDNISEGEITYEDILKVQPFGNAICVVEISGQDILDALEFGARMYPAENGGFLQVSGMRYEIDSSIPSSVTTTEDGLFDCVEGAYRVKNVMIGGNPLNLDQVYTLATHDYFLKKGGDGFTMLQHNTMLQDCIMLDNQIVINYITEYLNGEIGRAYANPYGEGRIVVSVSCK